MKKNYSKLLTLVLGLFMVSSIASAQDTFSEGGFECKVVAGGVEITGGSASGTLAIPAKLKNYTVVSIAAEAFKSAAITELDCSAATGLQRIGATAFAECKQLTTVKLPNSLTEMGALAFHHCTKISSINLQDTRLQVLEALFTKDLNDEQPLDNLVSLQLPETLKEIKSYALQFLGLKSITIPSGVTAFGEGVLEGTIYLEEFYWKGAKVNSLPRNTFLGEDALKVVYFLTNKTIKPDGLSDKHFFMCHKDKLKVYVTQSSYDVLVENGYNNETSVYSTLEAADWSISTYEYKAASKTGDYYYSTFYNANQATWFPAESFDVFSAVVEGSNVVMKEAAAEDGYYKVAKNEPCIIRSKQQEADYELKAAEFDNVSTMPADNDLIIADADITPSRLKYQYILGVKGGVVAFYRIASGSIKKGKIYIQASKAADRLDIVIDGEATAIQGVNKAGVENNGAIYNLQGVRVKTAQKGIYIQNGKKFVAR
jgi:hypothetical protein